VGVVTEAFHQLRQVRVEHRVERDVARPPFELRRLRQLAEQDQVGRLQEVALLGQLLDGIPAVQQHALVAVDERDPAPAGGGVHERRVVGHHPEFAGLDPDLPEIHRADRAVLDRDLVLAAGAVVGDGQRVGHASLGR
jgi:hypothetical protein